MGRHQDLDPRCEGQCFVKRNNGRVEMEMKMTDEELQKALQEGLDRAIDQAGGPRLAPFTPAQSRFLKVMIGEVMSKVVNKNQS